MADLLRNLLADPDEKVLETAFFHDDNCPHIFRVDWREEEDAIVEYCAECLGLESLSAELQEDETFVIVYHGHPTLVPLNFDPGDRDLTLRALNEVLQPEYELRLVVCSFVCDTLGFAALSAADWRSLEAELPQAVSENFVKLVDLPKNIFTEMTDEDLPEPARSRYRRML